MQKPVPKPIVVRVLGVSKSWPYWSAPTNYLKIGTYTVLDILINLAEISIWNIWILGVKWTPEILNICFHQNYLTQMVKKVTKQEYSLNKSTKTTLREKYTRKKSNFRMSKSPPFFYSFYAGVKQFNMRKWRVILPPTERKVHQKE